MNLNSKLNLSLFLFFNLYISISQAQIKISLDNPKHRFVVGESINFKVSSTNSGEGTYEAYYNPRPNKSAESIIQKGTFNASAGSDALIRLALNQPGLAFMRVTQNGASATVPFTVDPLSIQPIMPEPSDFDEFWQQQKQLLAAVPMNPQLNQINSLPNGSKVYILELGSIDNRKVYGYLAVPSGGGTFPAVLTFPPYGNSAFNPDPLVVTDFAEKGKAISLYLSVHNAPPNTVDNNAYKPDDLTRRDGFYNRLMILAGLRAIDYLTSREDFNGSLGVTGNSQGGGLALQVAGLDKRVTAVMSLSPSYCENDGERFNRASGFPYYIQAAMGLGLDTNLVIKNMKYYDANYFIKRFRGNLMILLGYRDEVTPAATQFAAYNQHREQSTLLHMREFGHNNPWEEYYLGQYAYFNQHLKGFQNNINFKKQFIINAGDDLEINTNSTQLEGKIIVDESSNNVTNIKWTKIEGPGEANFSSNGSLQTSVTFSQQGTYLLRLTADHDYKITDPNVAMYYTLSDYIIVKVGRVNNACDADTQKPIFTYCPTNITLTTTENSAVATWQLPTATDNCGTPSVTSPFSSGQSFVVGTTTVIYTAIDSKGNHATCQFNVLVKKNNACDEDAQKPIFTYCPTNITLTTTENSAIATWQLPTATDNCGTPSVSSGFSSGQSFVVGTTTVIYTALDSKGNQATCQFNVLVKKNETIPADLSVKLSSNRTEYTPYSDIVFKIILKNLGTLAVSNTKVQFKFPEYMVKNGTETVTGRVTGGWYEWCNDRSHCFLWDVNNLLGLDSAILTLPIYILKSNESTELTAAISSSTTVDNNKNNNQSTIIITANSKDNGFNPNKDSTRLDDTMLLLPTVVDDYFHIDIISTVKDNIEFSIFNSVGIIVFSEWRKVEIGQNILNFETYNLPRDAYFMTAKSKSKRYNPLRFMKF